MAVRRRGKGGRVGRGRELNAICLEGNLKVRSSADQRLGGHETDSSVRHVESIAEGKVGTAGISSEMSPTPIAKMAEPSTPVMPCAGMSRKVVKSERIGGM